MPRMPIAQPPSETNTIDSAGNVACHSTLPMKLQFDQSGQPAIPLEYPPKSGKMLQTKENASKKN